MGEECDHKGNIADTLPGGITNGNDMVAEYLRQSPIFPPAVVELALGMAEVGDRAHKLTAKA